MPILRLDNNAYAIKELSIGVDGKGRFLSLICPRATAYALCFSGGAPVRREELDLSEQELRTLLDGGLVRRDRYRIKGVPRTAFEAMAVFRDFQATPPEQIQIWAMVPSMNGEAVLYVPDEVGGETCYVPLRYAFQFTPGSLHKKVMQPGSLTVRLLDDGQYSDGALMYQVGNYAPIPLPESWLDRPIPLMTEEGVPVTVTVSEAFRGKYIPAKA